MGWEGRSSMDKIGDKKGGKEKRRQLPQRLKINLPYWSMLLENSFHGFFVVVDVFKLLILCKKHSRS